MTYQTIPVLIPNPKGFRLDAEIYKPDAPGKLPAVILFHGFTGYKEGRELVDISRRLAEHGIISVRFTASGFGGSEGDLEHDYRFCQHRNDAASVFEYVSTLAYVETSRIGIYGHSMGGRLALVFIQDRQIYAVCIQSAPVSFSGTLYEKIQEEWKNVGYFEKISGRDGKTIRVPYGYFVDSEKYDVLSVARKTRDSRVLVIAGKADTEVPWQETKKLYDALACPKDFVLFDDLEHKYINNQKIYTIVHKKILEFFSTYL